MDTEGKNYNPTGKPLFVLYECPRCGRNDCAIIPPRIKFNIPYWIQCGCGGWVMYAQAWFCEPYKGADIFVGFISRDPEILEALRHELKDATLEITPEGTMSDPSAMMQDPEFWKMLDGWKKDQESRRAMYR